MSLRLRKLITALSGAFLVSAVVTAVFACGPFFPSTILDRGDAGPLGSPVVDYHAILKKLGLPEPAFKALPPPDDNSSNPDYTAQTLTAELQDLRSAGVPDDVIELYRPRREVLDKNFKATTARLPAEFALYYAGARDYHAENFAKARKSFTAVLALPPEKRRYKTVWAAFMLGKCAAREGDRALAVDWFTRTREFALNAFADSTGLAAASLGEEARLAFERAEWLVACELYLRQHSTGDPTALNSLRFTASNALNDKDPQVLARFAQQPGPRAVITARLIERGQAYSEADFDEVYPSDSEINPPAIGSSFRSWLEALEHANVTAAREASLFALAAYRAGAFADCARWLKLAPADEAGAQWLRIKLSLRDGKVDEATEALSALVRASAVPFDSAKNATLLQGDLAQLRLARRDYVEALRLLLRAGYWWDAAYVAERVLTVDELTAFVSAETSSETAADSDSDADSGSEKTFDEETKTSLRNLLARRLVRADQLDQAAPYFQSDLAETFSRYVTFLRAGQDDARPSYARGLSLARAAEIMRHSGMELSGTELDPDAAIWGGDYDIGSFLNGRSRAGGASTPSDDEIVRVLSSAAVPNLRFHYRYKAADLAWEAAQLLPDNSSELVSLLIDAGSWLKARDPQAADRFFKALVNRCPDTDLGREANRKNWFPR